MGADSGDVAVEIDDLRLGMSHRQPRFLLKGIGGTTDDGGGVSRGCAVVRLIGGALYASKPRLKGGRGAKKSVSFAAAG